jgi:hypothetical protein
MISEAVGYSEVYQKSLVEDFLKQLFSSNDMEVDAMGKVMDILYNNTSFAKVFLDTIINERKKYIQFFNLHNLQHFANILNTITLNLDHAGCENYELNYVIIFLAERTFFTVNPKYFNKIYLCSILSKNKLYSTRTFWLDLIEYKLIRNVQIALTQTEAKLLSTDGKEGLMGNLSNKLKIMFGDGKEKENQKDKDTPIINNLLAKSQEIAKIYERLPLNKRHLADKVVNIKLIEIIKEFVPHFASFSFDPSEAIDLIVEISTKYKITKDRISYFVTMLNSYMFTVRNANVNKKKGKKSALSSQKTSEFKTNVFLISLKYLSNSDILNLLCINKAITGKLTKKAYKMILHSKDIKLKQRLDIWKSILNIVK